MPVVESKPKTHIIAIGGSGATWRLSLRRARPCRLLAGSIDPVKASTCSTIGLAVCATFRICSQGTGLSGGHYAIIEQGRIGQILSAKPMDRRTIIEEAAGITKFRVRQRAAEARLESARSNLSRVSDIISEIERQVNSLRRQAAKARRYRIQREELRDLLRHVYVAEDRSLVALLEQTQTQLEGALKKSAARCRVGQTARKPAAFATQNCASS